MNERKEFVMSDEQLAALLDACNAAWQQLGREMGFDWATVRPAPGGDPHRFTAVPTASAPLSVAADTTPCGIANVLSRNAAFSEGSVEDIFYREMEDLFVGTAEAVLSDHDKRQVASALVDLFVLGAGYLVKNASHTDENKIARLDPTKVSITYRVDAVRPGDRYDI